MIADDDYRVAAMSVDYSDLAVSLVDLRSQEVIAASKSLLALLDSDRQDLVGRHVGDFIVGKQSGALPLLASGHLDGAEADRVLKSPDGDTLPVHAWIHVLGNKRPARFAIVLLMDRRPATSENTVSTVAEELRVYGAVDVQWRIDHVSSGIHELLGYEPDDVAGMPLPRLIHPDDFAGIFAALAAAHTSRLGALARARLSHADGTWQSCRMRIAPLAQTPGFGFIVRPTSAPDAEPPVTDIDAVLRRLNESLQVEHSLPAPSQLPTTSELPALGQLTSTEWEILVRFNAGASPEDISFALRRDPRTVRMLLSSIFEKLGVSTTEELTALLATASGASVA